MNTPIEVEMIEREPPVDRASDRIEVSRRSDGQLLLVRGEARTPVQARCCFPWSQPNRYVSLRDLEGEEHVLIGALEQLSAPSRAAVESALAEAGFVLEVTRVERITEEYEIRSWEVETRQGPRRFQTRRDEWPREVTGAGLLIRDVAGDLYYVPDHETLDDRSQKLLDAFVD